jgi:CheY-like chemotaxis protein
MRRPEAALRVLVVEDEAILAMDIEMTVEECGHVVAGDAVCLHSAEALPDSLNPDLAFVDISLAQNTSGLDVSSMIQRRWPYTVIVFVTANASRIPTDFAGAHGVLSKPFSHRGLKETLGYLTEGICDPPPHGHLPDALQLSPKTRRLWDVAMSPEHLDEGLCLARRERMAREANHGPPSRRCDEARLSCAWL